MMQLYSLLILTLFTMSIPLAAQELPKSRQSSPITFIYKLTEQEARSIYTKNLWVIDSSYFHTVVDSYPTDSIYTASLSPGHYLRRSTRENKEIYEITTIQDFEAYILNNHTDLRVQVYNRQGEVLENASLKVGRKKLKYDPVSKTFIDKKSNRKGYLEVKYNGLIAYYSLSREYNNSAIRRATRKALYGTPLKYVWRPVNFIVHIPVDGVKSIKHGHTQGSIYKITNFFEKTYHKVACLFDDYHCDYYYSRNNFGNKYTGYLVFNKPMYAPGDTVKLKAFLVKKKGKPVNKTMQLSLWSYGKEIPLGTVSPYRPGGYKHEFPLHDSLELILDRNYQVSLSLKEDKTYIQNSFRYEEYELQRTKLTMRVDNEVHHRNQDLRLYLKGTDENDLPLPDARVQIMLSLYQLQKTYKDHIFVPDTLLYLEKQLHSSGETEIALSDTLFPAADFSYTLGVRMLTSDNEEINDNKIIAYQYASSTIDIRLNNDSIEFKYLHNGEDSIITGTILAEDNFGNVTPQYEGLLPVSLPVNPYFASYTARADSISESYLLSPAGSMLQCYSQRTSDSVFISIDNPRNLPFTYNLYRKKNELSAGHSDSLDVSQKTTSDKPYYISIRYLWAGKVKEENYSIPFYDKKLTISINQPRVVYPGQKSQITLSVTDTDGKPVKGVDLTAYGITKKFEHSPQTLPYLGKQPKGKPVINNFELHDINLQEFNGVNLDYRTWKLLAGIDSVEYYKFIFPGNGLYTSTFNSPDSITQFSPFVVEEGEILPIHVLYVDYKPVYFSWSTNQQPFSFSVTPGFHSIRLRTTMREITIDSVYFEKGKKLILSIEKDVEMTHVSTKITKPILSGNEQATLHKYIFPYKNNFGKQYAYMENANQLQLLNPTTNNSLHLAGPVVGTITFHLLDSFKTEFVHEPFFEYDFSPGLLKMRSLHSDFFPSLLYRYKARKELSDLVFTKKVLNNAWQLYLDQKRHQEKRYFYPASTSTNAGRLSIHQMEDQGSRVPLNVLLFSESDHEFIRVYPGNMSLAHNLTPDWYKIILFYPNATYHRLDSIQVKPNGLTSLRYKLPEKLMKDTFSLTVHNIIEKELYKNGTRQRRNDPVLKKIHGMYQQQIQFSGSGNGISGQVISAEDGAPLPGVNIVIKGTSMGTVTDIDGYYQLRVPMGFNKLVFSFVGLVTKEELIDQRSIITVELQSDVTQLQEVVVTGYASEQKFNLTSSISTITNTQPGYLPAIDFTINNALQGRVAGVTISSVSQPGGAVEIKLRGHSSISFNASPLYIINGIVFNGDITELDPNKIKNIQILKDANATSIYGARAVNGVVIIDMQDGSFVPMADREMEENSDFPMMPPSSLRQNFSDYAFWEPSLQTDVNGQATFHVTFPDDVTSWQTIVLGMNEHKQTGQAEDFIKSYKPLMAQLSVPRFMIPQDSSYAIGKTVNYQSDSVEVTTIFKVNEEELQKRHHMVGNAVIDTLSVFAGTDSLSVTYSLNKQDGYFDGEIREIPVFRKGLEKTEGGFHSLDKDTTFTLSFDTMKSDVILYAQNDVLEVLENEIRHIRNYRYNCNEQIASKLYAALTQHQIELYHKRKSTVSDEIMKLIKRLEKNQKSNGLWGWWKESPDNYWITLHIVRALKMAEESGFEVKELKETRTDKFIWDLENSRDSEMRLRMLEILSIQDQNIGYEEYIKQLENSHDQSLNYKLRLIHLRQQRQLPYGLDTLKAYENKTLFGNIFFSSNDEKSSLVDNEVENTIIAYSILQNHPQSSGETKQKIRNYLLEKRGQGNWRNTYESARIVTTLVPGFLEINHQDKPAELIIAGSSTTVVKDFPFEMTLAPDSPLKITKTGTSPVYFTAYQRYWEESPETTKGDFEIRSWFDQEPEILEAGKEVRLLVEVTVHKDAEYVMINIPIPGGCSYAEKPSYFRNETHREYFKHETTIFSEKLVRGTYQFSVKLLPRYSGKYTLNPAKVELMYFPTFMAHNEISKVRIE